MEDINIDKRPYSLGDKLLVTITVTDENKSFDFLGKAMYNKLDISDFGFTIDAVAFSKDKYVDHIPMELRTEIQSKLNKAFEEISDLIQIY